MDGNSAPAVGHSVPAAVHGRSAPGPARCAVHLTASRSFGGPERQMLGLAENLEPDWRSVVASFAEQGCCEAFLDQARNRRFAAVRLAHDTPRLWAASRELEALLRRVGADVLLCNGYKANLLGLLAARRVGIPAIGVSRGWTGETWRVRLYDAMDRRVLRRMDRVVCVSEGQAAKTRRGGVPQQKIAVIRNAVQVRAPAEPEEEYRRRLQGLFGRPMRAIVGAAGRLSPEKGFEVLVDASAAVVRRDGSTGFALFGEGPEREALATRIDARGLREHFILAGHRPDFGRYLPHLDLVVLSSYTEGLPNVVLEALAAGVPVVASAVGGVPEIVTDGETGRLVPPGDSAALARAIAVVLSDETGRRAMALRGRRRVEEGFTFSGQAEEYRRLFALLIPTSRRGTPHAA